MGCMAHHHAVAGQAVSEVEKGSGRLEYKPVDEDGRHHCCSNVGLDSVALPEPVELQSQRAAQPAAGGGLQAGRQLRAIRKMAELTICRARPLAVV